MVSKMEIMPIIDLKNLYNWWENVVINNRQLLKEQLKRYFESIDQKIFMSNSRKNEGYISKDICSRKILTIYGNITFKRRRYKYFDVNTETWKYVYLADKNIGIEKHERITSYVKFRVLELIGNGNRYEDILNTLDITLSKMSISNIISSFDFKELANLDNYEIKKISLTKCLYIQFDDTFIVLRNKRKKQKYRVRFVTFHTGYDKGKSTKNRNVIANKRSFFKIVKVHNKINTVEFIHEVYNFAKKFYDNVDHVKVIISGDGAKWIRQVSQYWPGSFYIFDKFHAFRKLNQALIIHKDKKNKALLKIVKSYFEDGLYDEIQYILRSFLENSEYKHKARNIKETISYFKSNKIGIINQKNQDNMGCHIESDISHNIKWLLGYGSKAFSFSTFHNMLTLKVSKLNQIALLQLLKERLVNRR